MDAYSQIAGAMVFVLVAVFFILFLILNSPKYESTGATVAVKKLPEIRYPFNLKFEAVNKLVSGLNFAFRCTLILITMFLLTLIFLIKTV